MTDEYERETDEKRCSGCKRTLSLDVFKGNNGKTLLRCADCRLKGRLAFRRSMEKLRMQKMVQDRQIKRDREEQSKYYQSYIRPHKCSNDNGEVSQCLSNLNQQVQTFKYIHLCVKRPLWRAICDLCWIHSCPPIDVERLGSDEKPKTCSNNGPWVNCQSNRSGITPKFTKNINHGIQPTGEEGYVVHQPMYFSECDACREFESCPDQKRCKSCGCWKHKFSFFSVLENKFKSVCMPCYEKRDTRRPITLNSKIGSVFHGAKLRNYTVSMTKEQIARVVQSPCTYCGELDENGFSGVDRIDSRIGEYRIDNVVPCCGPCNVTKHVLPIQTFIERMLHYSFHHCFFHDSSKRCFPNAFNNPNPRILLFESAKLRAADHGILFLFTEEEYYKALHGTCRLCWVNPATRLIRYKRPGPLSPTNCTACCSHCGRITRGVSPFDLPRMASRVVFHIMKTGLLQKVQRNQPIYMIEDEDESTTLSSLKK